MSFNEENFPELPENWLTVKVSDVHKNVSNFEKVKTQDYLNTGRYPIIDQGAKFIGGYSNDALKVISVDTPVVVFGDHTRILKFVNFPFVAGADGTKILQPFDIINPRTFFYFLQAISLPDRGYGRHFQYLRESQIPLPPLAEQIRIADKLDALLSRVDAGRERLERVPKLVKRFRQSVLSAAVSGELTREWRGGGDADWEEVTLNDVCKKITDGTHFSPPSFSEGEYEYVTAKNIRPWGLDLGNITYIDFKTHNEIYSRCSPEKGDVLYIKDGATTGLAIVNPLDRQFSLLSSVALLKPNKLKISGEYLCFLMNSPIFRVAMLSEMNGSAIRRVVLKQIKQAVLLTPPLPEQAEIVRRVEALFALADRLEARAQAALARYSRLTPALLAKAFRGELVPQDPADEPASVLLERIRVQRETAGPAKKAPGRGRKPGVATPNVEVGAGAGEPQSGQKRGRGRPRKVQEGAQQTSRGIPVVASAEEAIRLLEERARAEREGKVTVQAGLFGE